MFSTKKKIRQVLVLSLACLQVLLPAQSIAGISNLPPLVKPSVPPNIFYTLDDSGSMMFEVLPDTLTPVGDATDGTRDDIFSYCPGGGCWIQFVFPQPLNVYNINGDGNYGNAASGVVGFNDNVTVARWRSSVTNSAYYDPAIRYDPWVEPNSITDAHPFGSLMPNANPLAAKFNPVAPTGGSNTASINLTVATGLNDFTNPIPTWLKDSADGIVQEKRSFYPALYYAYNPLNLATCTTSKLTCFKRMEIKLTTDFGTKAATRTDCVNPGCTYTEEIQNFANWFQYYRSRILMARGASGRAFANQMATARVGFGTINTTNTVLNYVSDDFGTVNKKAFLNTLYTKRMGRVGTPLRKAVDEVGKYFMDASVNGPWQTQRGVGDVSTQISCRQNYNILMTDGAWNGGGATGSAAGEWDNANGPSITAPNGTAYSYTPVTPYKDGTSNTLADVAMYYWNHELRPLWPKEKKNVPLPKDGVDTAYWQHLVQYTVGLGVVGQLNPSTDLPALIAGTKSWPPASDSANQVDDLWHAAVNARGKYFSASNPTAFADALNKALNEISARTGDAAAIATSKNTLDVGLKIYTSTYQTSDWSGRLEQKALDSKTGAISKTDWSTDNKIPGASFRNIVMAAATGSGGIEFLWSSLATEDKAVFEAAAALYPVAAKVTGSTILDYVRGDQTMENNPFRKRKVVLGDLVNSDPQYVGEGKDGGYLFLPADINGKTTYAKYLSDKKSSAPTLATVYVGSNDGMLHAFNATDAASGGSERFAFIPKVVFANLPDLARPDYTHRFYVDGTVQVADAAIVASTTDPWRTVLVGGTGAGGKSIYALDVTAPASFDKTKVLWERNATTPEVDDDMGYSIPTPQIGVMRDGTWVAIYGNGYQSKNLKAVLYVVNLKTGTLIKKIDTGVGGLLLPNGLSTPKLLLNADSTIQAVYAGDLQGNMWKFDATTAEVKAGEKIVRTSAVSLAFGGKALFKAVNGARNLPITAQPQVYPNPVNGVMVVFGTGSIFDENDYKTKDVEEVFGIWDYVNKDTSKPYADPAAQSQLVEQALTTVTKSGVVFYKVTNNLVKYQYVVPASPTQPTPPTTRGWFIKMNVISGERIVTDPILFEDQIIFTTIIPGSSTDPCTSDGLSTTLQISPLNGAPLGYRTIDVTGDGKVDSSDEMVSGRQTNSTFGTAVVRMGNRSVKIFQADSKTAEIRDAKLGLSQGVPTARLWRQILIKQ